MPRYPFSYILASHRILEDSLPYTIPTLITRKQHFIAADGPLYLFARYIGEKKRKEERREKSVLEETIEDKEEDVAYDAGSENSDGIEEGEIVEEVGEADEEIIECDKARKRSTFFIHATFGSDASDPSYKQQSDSCHGTESDESYGFYSTDSAYESLESSDSDSNAKKGGIPANGLPTPSTMAQSEEEEDSKMGAEGKIVDFENPFLIEELKWLIEMGFGARRVFDGVEWWFDGFRGPECKWC